MQITATERKRETNRAPTSFAAPAEKLRTTQPARQRGFRTRASQSASLSLEEKSCGLILPAPSRLSMPSRSSAGPRQEEQPSVCVEGLPFEQYRVRIAALDMAERTLVTSIRSSALRLF